MLSIVRNVKNITTSFLMIFYGDYGSGRVGMEIMKMGEVTLKGSASYSKDSTRGRGGADDIRWRGPRPKSYFPTEETAVSANIYNAQIFSSAILRQQELHETLLKSDCNSSYLIYWQLKIIQWECNGKQSQTQGEDGVAKMGMGWQRWGTRVAKMGYPGG